MGVGGTGKGWVWRSQLLPGLQGRERELTACLDLTRVWARGRWCVEMISLGFCLFTHGRLAVHQERERERERERVREWERVSVCVCVCVCVCVTRASFTVSILIWWCVCVCASLSWTRVSIFNTQVKTHTLSTLWRSDSSMECLFICLPVSQSCCQVSEFWDVSFFLLPTEYLYSSCVWKITLC